MVPKGLLVAPEAWRVVASEGTLSFVSESSGRFLASESAERQIEVMHGMGVWALLLNQLEVTSGRLLTYAMANPHLRRHDAPVLERNRAVAALACPDPRITRELLNGSRQLTLWREAA